jgi:hypothetical protein
MIASLTDAVCGEQQEQLKLTNVADLSDAYALN